MVKTYPAALPSYRLNIVYRIHPKVTLEKFVDSIYTELAEKRINFPKTVIYVRQYTDCYTIYIL